MDVEARQRLIQKALAMFNEGATLVAVPMEEFFTGNTDDGSFGRHMQTSRDIPIAEYAQGFRSIRARPQVQEIYVQVHEVPDDTDPVERTLWPSAFVIFIITTATDTEIEHWLRPLEPRYIDSVWQLKPGIKAPWSCEAWRSGMRAVLVEML